MNYDSRIPVTLLTGFLGSGKTTLLNKLLRHPGLHDSAVVINEIGEAGLDHILVRSVEDSYIADNTVLLGSGCLCCTLRTELADTLRDLHFKRMVAAIPEFGRLVIETTGLADPGPILANLLNEPMIAAAYRLDAVVVAVDGVHGAMQLERHAEARKQAAVADVLLLTKTDAASAAAIAELAAALAALNPGAAQYRIAHGEIDPAAIVDAGLLDREGNRATPHRWLRAPEEKAGRGMRPTPAHGIGSFTVTLPTPLTWARLHPALQRLCATEGERLLRLKGVVRAADMPSPIAVHAVQHTLYAPTPIPGCDQELPGSLLVLIGQGLDESRIRATLMQL